MTASNRPPTIRLRLRVARVEEGVTSEIISAIVSCLPSSLRFENADGIIRTMAASPGWMDALQRTRRAAFGRLAALLGAGDITPAVWEDGEALLIQGDLGPALASKIRRNLHAEGGRF